MSSDSDPAPTEASIWLARLERGLQAHEGSLLREWLQRPAHRDAIVDAAKLWHGPDIVAVLAELVPVGFGNAPPARSTKRRHPLILIFGFCVAVLVIATPFGIIRGTMPGVIDSYKPYQRPKPWGMDVYSTQPGETRAVALPDGSRLKLNGHSRIGVLYAAGLREAMLDYGEALFQVQQNRQRPLEVNVEGRHLQASRSRFDVRVIRPRIVELTVLEGSVTVAGLPWHRPGSPAEARIFNPDVMLDTTVGPMQSVLLQDATLDRRTLTAADVDARLRWQPPDILYVNP